jgi:hypothetical protein
MSWSAACWIPRRSLRVAASSPALATAWVVEGDVELI